VPVTGLSRVKGKLRRPSKGRTPRARSLDYMGLEPGQALRDIMVEKILHRSCTTAGSRIGALHAFASGGRKESRQCQMGRLFVRRSGDTGEGAGRKPKGLDRISSPMPDLNGAETRLCSACLGMNPEQVPAGGTLCIHFNRKFVGAGNRC